MREEYYSTPDVLNNFIPNMVFERILINKSKPIAKLLILFLERERLWFCKWMLTCNNMCMKLLVYQISAWFNEPLLKYQELF